MYADLVGEGWDNPDELREQYKPTSNGERLIDGVIMVTASLRRDLDTKISEVKEHFLAAEGEPLNPDICPQQGPFYRVHLNQRGKRSSRPNERKGTVSSYQVPESLYGPNLPLYSALDSRMGSVSLSLRAGMKDNPWERNLKPRSQGKCPHTPLNEELSD